MNSSSNINDRISPELRLMLAGAIGDSTRVQHLLTLPVDWELFLQLTAYHQVYAIVYKTFSHLDNPRIPENVMISLRTQYKENALRALSMAGETIRMVDCLESQGVRVVVLKGMALASHLYGDITIRPSSDIDILVSPDLVELAAKILESEGYRETQPLQGLTPRQRQVYLRVYSHPHPHHLAFWHSNRDILLEMHWDLGHFGQVVLPMPADASIERIQAAGSSLPVLADEEWLLYLILHGASHAWFCLRWLVDIGKFMQREIDWERIESLARSHGMQSILHNGLILANRLLEVPLPSGYQSVVISDRHAERLSSLAISLCLSLTDHQLREPCSDYNNYWAYSYNYQMRVGWRNKVNYILSLCRPTVSDIRLVSLPNPLYPLYYVIRPVTFVCGLFACSQKAKAG